MRKTTVAGLVLGLLTTFAPAQEIVVPDSFEPGDLINVGFRDPKRAGQTVTVVIDNGGLPVPVVFEVQVQLNAQGEGSVRWDVPMWMTFTFSASGAKTVFR